MGKLCGLIVGTFPTSPTILVVELMDHELLHFAINGGSQRVELRGFNIEV